MDVEGKLYLSKPGFAENCSGRTPFKVFGELTYASPVSKNSHILSHLGAGTTWCSYLPLTEQFALGGPFRLSNFRTDELRGLSYFYGTLGYLYGLSSMDALFGKKLYLGVWYEIGGVGRGFQDIRCHQDFLAGFACDSFLGPIFLGASINEQRDVTFHIGIGLRF
jgi:outer membrane translocation and assembly module TamA